MGTNQELSIEIANLNAELDRLQENIQNVIRYLNLNKFNHPNHWVNPDDIIERLRNAL